jgi:hypothetical protein
LYGQHAITHACTSNDTTHHTGGCYTGVFKTEFPKALGVCTCNIFNGLSPSSRNGDASISYGADACNTPNYVNILSIILSIIVVYVVHLCRF